MEISPNAMVAAAVAQKQASTEEQVQISMLKKAINTQSENALSLIADLPQPVAPAPVGNIGQNISVKA